MLKWSMAASLVVAAALGVTACGGNGSGASAAGGSGKPYKIVLSNNFMGNDWRAQMENQARIVAESPQYRDKVKLEIQNSDTTPTAQIASLQSIIRQKPDAIVVDAASPTALNATIAQACARRIKVVAFDQSVTAPCAHKVHLDYEKTGHDQVEFIAKAMHGRGNLLMDRGVPGATLPGVWNDVWKKTLAQEYPNIHVVGVYSGQFSVGPEVQAVSSLLAQHPQVDGVLSIGYCSGVIKAFKAAGRKPVPMSCLNINGSEIACAKAKVPCIYAGAPSWASGVAIEDAVKMLDGQKLPEWHLTYNKMFVNNPEGVEFDHQLDVLPLTPGVNYYPDGSPALVTPISYGNFDMTPAQVLGQ